MNKTTITLTVQTEPILLARITVLLRKYEVEIDSFNRQAGPTAGQEIITLQVRNLRNNLVVAMKKLERLVPVITLTYSTAA